LVKVNKSGVVAKFVEKPVLKDWVNGGFMVFNKEIFDYLRPGEMEHEALKRLIKKKQLSLFIHEQFWHAMDTYSDVENLNKFWDQHPEWKIWED
jgi:glucose-1-phosphate cytidylyltransferase